MGTIFYVADLTNRRIFMLGKGRWANVGPDYDSLVQKCDPRHMVHRFKMLTDDAIEELWGKCAVCKRTQPVHDACVKCGAALEPNDSNREYLDIVCRRLWAFCAVAGWKVELRCDAGDGYPDEYDGARKLFATVESVYWSDILDADPKHEEQRKFERTAAREMYQ